MTAISSPLQAIGNFVLPKYHKRFSLYVVYGTLLLVAYAASFLLRYDLPLDHKLLVLLFVTAPVVVIANLFGLEVVGQLGKWWQYTFIGLAVLLSTWIVRLSKRIDCKVFKTWQQLSKSEL
jgi:FtsH-binding integral membrane protein